MRNLGVAFLVLAGCAHSPSEAGGGGSELALDSDTQLTLRAGGEELGARVDARGVLGPQLQLQRDGDALRGQAYGGAAHLTFDPRGVRGDAFAQPVELALQSGDGQLHLQGQYAGAPSDLRVDGAHLTGTMGACAYELESLGGVGVYRGQRDCGQGPAEMTLTLPQSWLRQPVAERAAILAVVLSR